MTTEADVRGMNTEELRRWLAEHHMGLSYEQSDADYRYDPNGPVWWYTIRQHGKSCGTFMISGSAVPWPDYVWTRVYAEMKIPNWPHSTADALALCLEMLDRLNEESAGEMYQLEFGTCCVSFVLLEYGGGILDSIGAETRDAMGMAQIAALALLQHG